MGYEHIIPYQWDKGTRPPSKNQGRKKKILTEFKDIGYSKKDVISSYENLVALTEDEADGIMKDPKATLLEKLVIASLLKAKSKGDYRYAAQIIEMVAGKAVQTHEVKKPTFEGFNLDNLSAAEQESFFRLAKKAMYGPTDGPSESGVS